MWGDLLCSNGQLIEITSGISGCGGEGRPLSMLSLFGRFYDHGHKLLLIQTGTSGIETNLGVVRGR